MEISLHIFTVWSAIFNQSLQKFTLLISLPEQTDLTDSQYRIVCFINRWGPYRKSNYANHMFPEQAWPKYFSNTHCTSFYQQLTTAQIKSVVGENGHRKHYMTILGQILQSNKQTPECKAGCISKCANRTGSSLLVEMIRGMYLLYPMLKRMTYPSSNTSLYYPSCTTKEKL